MRRILFTTLIVLTILGSTINAQISRPAAEDGPTDIMVRIGMLDFSEVSDERQSFTANIYFEAHWRDSRLVHEGESDIKKPVGEVWTPEFAIANRRGSFTNALPNVVSVTPDGQVISRQLAYGDFAQRLDLRDFPFDRQEFVVQLVSVNSLSKDVKISKDPDLPSRVSKNVSLPDWTIENWSVLFNDYQIEEGAPKRAAVALKFEAKRKQGYFVYKIILPLILIVSMSWVVFWIPLSATSPRLGLPATVMLTLIAYRYSIDQILPQISYLTRIDLFILLSTLLVYVSLIETAIATALHGKDKKEWARRLDWCSRFVFPVLFAICTLVTLVF